MHAATPGISAIARPTVDDRWKIVNRTGTGLFVASERDTLLFRVERQNGTLVLYPWDRKLGGEIRIVLSDLLTLVV